MVKLVCFSLIPIQCILTLSFNPRHSYLHRCLQSPCLVTFLASLFSSTSGLLVQTLSPHHLWGTNVLLISSTKLSSTLSLPHSRTLQYTSTIRTFFAVPLGRRNCQSSTFVSTSILWNASIPLPLSPLASPLFLRPGLVNSVNILPNVRQ